MYLYAAPLQKRPGFDFLLSISPAAGKRSVSVLSEVLCLHSETMSFAALAYDTRRWVSLGMHWMREVSGILLKDGKIPSVYCH